MDTQEEILDLVNVRDEVVSHAPRSWFYANKSKNFRTVNAFIINDLGKIWIPTRTNQKQLWPSYWDASVGGHVQSGETYEAALLREAKEEVNLDLGQCDYRFIHRFSPFDSALSSFSAFYLIRHNGPVDLNMNDFSGGAFYGAEGALHAIQKGQAAKPDLKPLLKFLRQAGLA